MLSLVALPLVVANTREGLQAIPSHVREASYAVGKTKIATTRRVLLPAARPSVITGAMLGVGRVIGDTAIVLLLLGGTLTFSSRELHPAARPAPRHRRHADRLHLLQRADRRREPTVEGIRGGVRADADRARAQPRRRLRPASLAEGGHDGTEEAAAGQAPDRERGLHAASRGRSPAARDRDGRRRIERQRAPPERRVRGTARRRATRGTAIAIDRMQVEELSVAYGTKPAVKSVSLPIRQGEVLALIGPSGCGKTTLLRSLNRLTELTRGASASGRITLDGVDIASDGADRAPSPGDDGLPAAQPVSDERVRQRRLRAARAGLAPSATGRRPRRGPRRAGAGRAAR